MSTRELVEAMIEGDTKMILTSFENAMKERVSEQLETMHQIVARNMFKEAAENKGPKVSSNHIHISDAGNGKYKVHAVGKNFAHGINVGEHLSDTELDDFQEMGGKIKHVKHTED